jgi:hypothetical protein
MPKLEPGHAPSALQDSRLSRSFKSFLKHLRHPLRDHSNSQGNAAPRVSGSGLSEGSSALSGTCDSFHILPSDTNLSATTALGSTPAVSAHQPPLSDTVVAEARSLSTGQVPPASTVISLQRAWSHDARQVAAVAAEGTTLPGTAVLSGIVRQRDSRREELARLWAQSGPNTPAPTSTQDRLGSTSGRGCSRGGGVQYTVLPANSNGVPLPVLNRVSRSSAGSSADSTINRRSSSQTGNVRAPQLQLPRLDTGTECCPAC